MEDPNDFSNFYKSVSEYVPGSQDEVGVQIMEFVDKLVISVTYNGQKDSTYKIPIPNTTILGNLQTTENEFGAPRNELSCVEDYEEEDAAYDERHGLTKDLLDQTANIEPICLIGDSSNYKLRILCTQLLGLLLSVNATESRDVILSVSSRLVNGEKVNDNDFDNLFFVMQLGKKCYLQRRKPITSAPL